MARTKESNDARLKSLEGEASRSISKMQRRVTEVGDKYNIHEKRIQEVLSWKGTVKRTLETIERDVAKLDENLNYLFRQVEEMAEQPGRGPEQQQSSEAVQELADREDEGLSIASREEGKKTSKPSLNDIDEGVHAPKTSIKKRGREEDTESSSEEGEVKSSQPEPKPAAGGKPKAAKASSKSVSPMNLHKKPSGKGTRKKK